MINGTPINQLDLDTLPTGAAIKVLHASVSQQAAQVEALHADITEIKTLVKSATMTARLLVASVPVVAALASAVIWAILHISVKP